jgi:hypothetical protein
MTTNRFTPASTPTPQTNPLRKLSVRATKVFLTLVDGLEAGSAKKIDNARGAFMAVSIDCLFVDRSLPDGRGRTSTYAIAHRYEANGDLIPDPDVEFLVVSDPQQPESRAIYPTAIDHGPLGYRRYVHLDSAGEAVRVRPRGQADLARFCDLWMDNIAHQQGLVRS